MCHAATDRYSLGCRSADAQIMHDHPNQQRLLIDYLLQRVNPLLKHDLYILPRVFDRFFCALGYHMPGKPIDCGAYQRGKIFYKLEPPNSR